MPLIGFTEWKGDIILAHNVGQTIRMSRCIHNRPHDCYPPKLFTDTYEIEYPGCMELCEDYKPRIKVGDEAKLYMGLRQRKYCKQLEKKCDDVANFECPEIKGNLFEPCKKDCEHRGAYHFRTWKIRSVITKKFKDLTEEDARLDGFTWRPWGKIKGMRSTWGCGACPVHVECFNTYTTETKCTSLMQLKLYFKDAKPDDMVDVIQGMEI